MVPYGHSVNNLKFSITIIIIIISCSKYAKQNVAVKIANDVEHLLNVTSLNIT